MDQLKQDFLSALKDAIETAGSQSKLADHSGMHQSRISDYLTERYGFNNITVGTLRKLFPEIKIIYGQNNESLSEMENELERQLIGNFKKLSSSEKIQLIIDLSQKAARKEK